MGSTHHRQVHRKEHQRTHSHVEEGRRNDGLGGGHGHAKKTNPKKNMVHEMRPYAGADYDLTLCPLQSRLQHIYYGQSYSRFDLNPVPESTLSPSQGLRI
jgi:hypothetical protein